MANKNITIKSVSSIGLSFPLFITFLVLKLTNVITWSWWWVTSPLWIPMILILLLGIPILYLLLIEQTKER